MIDTKIIEFLPYHHMERTVLAQNFACGKVMLEGLISAMELRYDLLRKGWRVEDMPYVLFVIDEFADLIMQDTTKTFHTKLCQLSQKCRAAKICIVLATQRPSASIINGNIKANFPARISCRVASNVDSKVVLDVGGAENLWGKGDALLNDGTRHLERFQIAYTDAQEVSSLYEKWI
jgi:DNA segregation ATPase FtsK/SpoIIIE-like protein